MTSLDIISFIALVAITFLFTGTMSPSERAMSARSQHSLTEDFNQLAHHLHAVHSLCTHGHQLATTFRVIKRNGDKVLLN